MSLRAHLRELRNRLFFVAVGLLLGAVVGWMVYTPVFEALIRPLQDVAAERDGVVAINFAGLGASFDMQIQVSLFLGVLLSSPWWMYQLWRFVTPGLRRRERLYTIGFLGAAVPLFLAGAAVAWWALPHAVRVLTGFTPAGANNLIDAQMYMTFVMRLLLAFGLAFLLPVLIVALDFANLVHARTWLKGWRWAIVVAFTFSAIATPTPDAFTMIFVALPIIALYFVAVGISVLHDRREDRRRVAAGLPRLDGTMADEVEAPAAPDTAEHRA
jgi:sec-independent protein translocase protein TatC